MPPALYLHSSYYEKWFYAITTLLVEKGVLSAAEVAGE
jgi:nitrile hydratase